MKNCDFIITCRESVYKYITSKNAYICTLYTYIDRDNGLKCHNHMVENLLKNSDITLYRILSILCRVWCVFHYNILFCIRQILYVYIQYSIPSHIGYITRISFRKNRKKITVKHNGKMCRIRNHIHIYFFISMRCQV